MHFEAEISGGAALGGRLDDAHDVVVRDGALAEAGRRRSSRHHELHERLRRREHATKGRR